MAARHGLHAAKEEFVNHLLGGAFWFDEVFGTRQSLSREEDTMLKTFSVVLLTLAMSAGFADAGDRNTIPGCAVGKRATAKCVCGMRAFRPLLCRPGQWCHPSGWCTTFRRW